MNKFECCLSDDKHFCNEPILLKDNCNVCKNCISELDCNEIRCNTCGKFHDIRELRKSIENVNVNLLRSMEQENLNQLFQALKERFSSTIKNIEGFLCTDYFENNISFIESEVYIRIESLKIQLDEFGENFREKLKKIKDTFNDLVSNETIRNIPEDLQNLHDNFKIDLDSFYVYQNKLRVCKKQIDDLKIHIPKMRFDWNNVNLEESIIGRLTHNYCDYTEIKSFKSYELPGFLWFARMKLTNNNNIFITDRRNKSIVLTDLNGNLVKNHQEQNIFSEPFAICVNKRNEIFIGDYIDKNIFTFDENFNLLRKFGNETLIESSSFAIDDDDVIIGADNENETISNQIPLLYVTSKFMNTVTVWNSDTGEFVNKFKINKPEYIQISDKKLFIVGRVNNSNIYTLSQHLSDANKNIIYSANCIFIVNKITYDMIHTIQLENCYDLKGLYVDNNLNIFTFGKEYRYEDNNENERLINNCNNFSTTKSRYLYVFNEKTGYCNQRTQIEGLHDLSDFIVIKNKMIICYRDTIKIIEFLFNV